MLCNLCYFIAGNDLVDEDVDIVGGNDPPISSFPPVEIEKDAAHRNSKCSSSSSSSSESGSSSSGWCYCVYIICGFTLRIGFSFLIFRVCSPGTSMCQLIHFKLVICCKTCYKEKHFVNFCKFQFCFAVMTDPLQCVRFLCLLFFPSPSTFFCLPMCIQGILLSI